MRRPRKPNGNMLAIIGAFLAGVALILLAFGHNLVRLFGGQQGQQTAIQSAALAAANDLSRIVISTDEFGYVSLSDDAPVGTYTEAGDKFYLPVRSVNTIVATARLDYIIGQKLNDPIIQAMAKADFDAMKNNVLPQLKTALKNALNEGGSAKDINGNDVKPFDDAVQAFKQNLKRQGSGADCNYVEGSMLLSLGDLTQGIPTNTPVPKPASEAPLTAAQQQNDCYMSDTALTINGIPFALGAVGQSVRLVDQTKWTDDNGLSFQVPAVVKAEADQSITNSQKANMIVHAIAAAQPASVYDPRPAPGALSVSFPDGPIGAYTSLETLRANGPNQKVTGKGNAGTLLTPNDGDYPTDPTVAMVTMPWMLSGTPTFTEVWASAYYDWLRRGGTKVNIADVVAKWQAPWTLPFAAGAQKPWFVQLTVLGQPIDTGVTIPRGVMHIWKFNADGTQNYRSVETSPYPISVVAENQEYAECLKAIKTGSKVTLSLNGVKSALQAVAGLVITDPKAKPNKKLVDMGDPTATLTDEYDAYLRNEVRNVGTIAAGTHFGGKHGGEPLDNPRVAFVKDSEKEYVAVLGDGGGYGIGGKPKQTGFGGIGNIPILGNQSDFFEDMPDDIVPYQEYKVGSGVRETYTTNGSCVELRFRRQIGINDALQAVYGSLGDIGYLAGVDPAAAAAAP